jgi:hypothetical protein
VGTNTVTCTAGDGNGNTNSCSFKVVVTKANSPTIRNLSYSPTPTPHISFSFDTLSGCNYVVEYKATVNGTSWTTLTTVPGDGSTKSVTDNGPLGAARFYRVRVP